MEGSKTLVIEKPKATEFHLEYDGDDINLMAQDDKGASWYVLTIKAGEALVLHPHLPLDIGFKVSTFNRYPLVKREE